MVSNLRGRAGNTFAYLERYVKVYNKSPRSFIDRHPPHHIFFCMEQHTK